MKRKFIVILVFIVIAAAVFFVMIYKNKKPGLRMPGLLVNQQKEKAHQPAIAKRLWFKNSIIHGPGADWWYTRRDYIAVNGHNVVLLHRSL
jgi:hypothetical protein